MIKRISALINQERRKKFLIYGIGQAFNLLSPFLVIPFIIRICGESGFGKVGLGFQLSLFFILIVDYAFDMKGMKTVSENRENKAVLQSVLNTAISTKVCLFLIAFLLNLILVVCFPFFRAEAALFHLSMLIVLAQVVNPIWFLQGLENFKLASLLNIGTKLLYVGLVFFGIHKAQDYIWVNAFLGFSNLVCYFAALVFVYKSLGIQFKWARAVRVRAILKNDFSFCLSQLAISARQLAPMLLTSYFLGFQMSGLYRVLEQIVTLFRTFCQVFLRFFYPNLCYKMVLDKADGFIFWKKYASVTVLSTIAGVVFVSVFAPEVLQFFNVDAIYSQEAIVLLRTILILGILIALTLSLEQLMIITNRNTIYIRTTIAGTLLNILLLLAFIQRWELYGVISALVLSELLLIALYFIYAYLFLRKTTKSVHE